MKEINIFKAQRVGDEITESIKIIIDKETPEIETNISTKELYQLAHNQYEAQGELLGNILLNSLPGGTIDELLIFLLTHKRSILKVKY